MFFLTFELYAVWTLHVNFKIPHRLLTAQLRLAGGDAGSQLCYGRGGSSAGWLFRFYCNILVPKRLIKPS